MWHAYRLSENTKSEEFYFASALKCLKYCFLLRKRAGGIIPKAIYNKLMAEVSADKAQAEAEPSTEVEQAKFFAQFKELKAKHPDAVLLFRVGDEYRTFGDDSEVVKAVCGASSFPHTALDTNLPLLVRAGKRVAICDDITAPQAKKATRKSAKKESK